MDSVHLRFPIGLSNAEEPSHQILRRILHIRIDAFNGFRVGSARSGMK